MMVGSAALVLLCRAEILRPAPGVPSRLLAMSMKIMMQRVEVKRVVLLAIAPCARTVAAVLDVA